MARLTYNGMDLGPVTVEVMDNDGRAWPLDCEVFEIAAIFVPTPLDPSTLKPRDIRYGLHPVEGQE